MYKDVSPAGAKFLTSCRCNVGMAFFPLKGGADYHDYHHYVGGQSQSNFPSVFTCCDYIYGTDKGYRYQKRLLQLLKEGSKSYGEQNQGSQHVSAQHLKSD